MPNLTSAGEKVPIECRKCPQPLNDPNPDHAADVLHVITRYASADREIKAGGDLFSQGERGDAIYSLIDGWVALYNLLEDGRRQILQFALPGAVFAFLLTPRALMTCGAQALTDVVVRTLPSESLERLSGDHPDIGMRLARLIAQDRSMAYEHLSSVGRRSAKERVAQLLFELFFRYRARWPDHCTGEIHLPITQEHIGDAVGLTGVHVNRVLRELGKRGIVEFHYGRLRVLNPQKLADVAGLDPAMLFEGPDVMPRSSVSPRTAGKGSRAPVCLDMFRPLRSRLAERQAVRGLAS